MLEHRTTEQGRETESYRWCALHTRHQHEKSVAAMLATKGFEVFLPTYETTRRWTDRTKRIRLALFPGYLFWADQADRRIQILATPGVHTIVKSGNLPAVIPNEEIDAIRKMVESTFGVEPHPFLQEGNFVRIRSGPLSGLEGILTRKKDAFRLVLSVELLGRAASVEIDSCSIEPIGGAQPAILTPRTQPAVEAGILMRESKTIGPEILREVVADLDYAPKRNHRATQEHRVSSPVSAPENTPSLFAPLPHSWEYPSEVPERSPRRFRIAAPACLAIPLIVTVALILVILAAWFWASNYYVFTMQVLVQEDRSDPAITTGQNAAVQTGKPITADQITSEIALLQGGDVLHAGVVNCGLAENKWWTSLRRPRWNGP
jgi:transcription antitermination factor NusG